MTCRRPILMAVLAAAMTVAPSAAHAAYRGSNGPLTWEAFSSQDTEGGPPFAEVDTIRTQTQTLATCSDESGPLTCEFGTPSYSPDGATVAVSRLTPTDAFNDRGGAGRLMVLGSDGSRPTILPRQTADDEDPAFLPDGRTIVFDGRSRTNGERDLYEITTSGTGRHRLTSKGGSYAAPCSNGKIVFVRHHYIDLLNPHGGSVVRVTHGYGRDPSCSPNSRQIAFERGGSLYTIGTDGTHLQLVTRTSSYAPVWSPNGREIAFMSKYYTHQGTGDETAIVVVRPSGRRVSKTVVADSLSNGETGMQSFGASAGAAWRPLAR